MRNIGFGIVILLAASTQVQAGHSDWKGYSGTNCLPASDNSDYTRSQIGGNFANMGVPAITVICPIVRDVQYAGAGRVQVRVSVRVRQDGGYCRLYSKQSSGAAFDFQHIVLPGDFSTITFSAVDSSNFGNYFIACRIPGIIGPNLPSYIRSYAVNELN